MTAIRRRSGPASLLRVHAWLILIALAATVGSATVFALTRPTTYVATSQVTLDPQQTGGTALRPEMASERQIALSGTVASRAGSVLERDPSVASRGLAVSVVLESSVLNIRYRAANADAAVAGARAFTQSYVDYRNGVAGTRIARVVTWPDGAAASGVNLGLILAVALIAGAFFGVSAAWLWDRVADRIRDAEELTDRSGLPVLGVVPRWRTQGQLAPPGPARDAFAYVAARLTSLVGERPAGVSVLVTSPLPAAGSSTVALNTAVALAAQGREVVLVADDLPRSELQEAGDDPDAPGLRQVLAAECSLESALRPTRWPHLSVLTVGTTWDAEDDDLRPDLLGEVLDQLSKGSTVVVDGPAILESANSLLLARKADVLLLVGDLRRGRRVDVEQSMALLGTARPAVAAWVANLPRRVPPLRPQRAPEPKSVAEAWSPTAARSDRVAS